MFVPCMHTLPIFFQKKLVKKKIDAYLWNLIWSWPVLQIPFIEKHLIPLVNYQCKRLYLAKQLCADRIKTTCLLFLYKQDFWYWICKEKRDKISIKKLFCTSSGLSALMQWWGHVQNFFVPMPPPYNRLLENYFEGIRLCVVHHFW